MAPGLSSATSRNIAVGGLGARRASAASTSARGDAAAARRGPHGEGQHLGLAGDHPAEDEAGERAVAVRRRARSRRGPSAKRRMSSAATARRRPRACTSASAAAVGGASRAAGSRRASAWRRAPAGRAAAGRRRGAAAGEPPSAARSAARRARTASTLSAPGQQLRARPGDAPCGPATIASRRRRLLDAERCRRSPSGRPASNACR